MADDKTLDTGTDAAADTTPIEGEEEEKDKDKEEGAEAEAPAEETPAETPAA